MASPNTSKRASIDDLDGLTLDAPKNSPVAKLAVTSIDDLPADITSIDLLVNFPASGSNGESIPIHTRIPVDWLNEIARIRELPGTLLPQGIWKTTGEFYRWAIFMAIREVDKIQRELDTEGSHDPIINARIFIERTGGNLAARAAVIEDARRRATDLGGALTTLYKIGEFHEASEMIMQWVEQARQLAVEYDSKYWERVMVKTLITEPSVVQPLVDLIDNGYIVDDYLLGITRQANLKERLDSGELGEASLDLDALPAEAPAAT